MRANVYQDLLRRFGMRASMSRSANCYDNAYMESFFGTLKRSGFMKGITGRDRKRD